MARPAFVVAAAALLAAQSLAQTPAYTYRKVMVPVRDGVRLETVILAPANATGPLPILFRRSPYGVPSTADGAGQGSLKALARDGYIFVVQNLRGRFGSEGTFELSSKADLEESESHQRNDRRLRFDRLAGEERAEQQRQGRHVRRLLRRADVGDDTAAARTRR